MKHSYEPIPPRKSNQTNAAYSKKVKKKSPFLRIFLLILLSFTLLLGAGAAYVLHKSSEALGQIGLLGSITGKVNPAESVKVKPTTLALMGLDKRPVGVKGGGLNTDVMMVASLNPKTKKVVVVSLPRDSKLSAQGYKARKANAFYAAFYMNAKNKKQSQEEAELAGMSAVREVLGELFDIDIKYSAIIDFKGFTDVVDALGGIEVDVDMRMVYSDSYDGTNINLEKGRQILKGKEALDFVRYRQSKDGKNMSSDFDRNRRQGEVVGAIFDKAMSFGGMMKIGSLIEAVGNNMKMDMPESEIKNMLSTYFNVKRSDITFITVAGTWKSPYVYLHDDSVKAARDALKSNIAE